jgi:molybdate transport system substrate-binding protein
VIRVAALLAALALPVAPLGACAGSDGGAGGKPRLTVSAAQSLHGAFEDYGTRFDDATARFSFAGSDALAAQIRQGVRPDVYAAANTELPRRLFEEGLVEEPVAFAHNRLVIAVPADSTIGDVADLGRGGIELAVGAETVPVGAYTREVLGRLPAVQGRAVLANVRSEEPDVSGVLGKLTQGAADAGLLYATDVEGVGGRLRTIELPRRLRPRVTYGAAVIKGAKQPEAARAFVDGLLSGSGRAALQRAGFVVSP